MFSLRQFMCLLCSISLSLSVFVHVCALSVKHYREATVHIKMSVFNHLWLHLPKPDLRVFTITQSV